MRKKNMMEFDRLSVAAFKEQRKNKWVLILDHVRSAHNVGAAFRLADAFLVESIYLCGITPTPPHPGVRKTALGAEETVDWHHKENTEEVLIALKKKGYTCIGIEQTHEALSLEQWPKKFPVPPPCALVFGHEVLGVSHEALKQVDFCLEIPQYGTKHSLNVSTCIGIVLWEFLRGLN